MIKEVHEKHNQKKWENHLQKVSSLPLDEEESLESDEDDGTDPDSKDSDDISNPLASSKNSKSLHWSLPIKIVAIIKVLVKQ